LVKRNFIFENENLLIKCLIALSHNQKQNLPPFARLEGRLRHEDTERTKSQFHRGGAEARRKPGKNRRSWRKQLQIHGLESGMENLRKKQDSKHSVITKKHREKQKLNAEGAE
jgi:hypothetical protein